MDGGENKLGGGFTIDDAFESDEEDPIRVYGTTSDRQPFREKRRPENVKVEEHNEQVSVYSREHIQRVIRKPFVNESLDFDSDLCAYMYISCSRISIFRKMTSLCHPSNGCVTPPLRLTFVDAKIHIEMFVSDDGCTWRAPCAWRTCRQIWVNCFDDFTVCVIIVMELCGVLDLSHSVKWSWTLRQIRGKKPWRTQKHRSLKLHLFGRHPKNIHSLLMPWLKRQVRPTGSCTHRFLCFCRSIITGESDPSFTGSYSDVYSTTTKAYPDKRWGSGCTHKNSGESEHTRGTKIGDQERG